MPTKRCKRPNQCELTHCVRGHHVTDERCQDCHEEGHCQSCGLVHTNQTCEEATEERDQVLEAELGAGWDPSP